MHSTRTSAGGQNGLYASVVWLMISLHCTSFLSFCCHSRGALAYAPGHGQAFCRAKHISHCINAPKEHIITRRRFGQAPLHVSCRPSRVSIRGKRWSTMINEQTANVAMAARYTRIPGIGHEIRKEIEKWSWLPWIGDVFA